VIYRETALPSRGRFIILGWESEVAGKVAVDSQEPDSENGPTQIQQLRYLSDILRRQC
jgi:hypothetical protein